MNFNGQPNMFLARLSFAHVIAPKAKHFEPIEHNFFVKWLKK
jgi:hypothetical protein